MAVDENMLSSEMAVEMRRIKRAMGQRDAANKRSIARGAGTSIDIEDAMAKDDTRRSLGKQAASRVASGTRTPVKSTPKTTSTNNPAIMSRSSRRMYSGLLENAPKKEAPAPAPTKSSGVRTSRSGGGDYPFTKSEPMPTKSAPSMTTGSRGDIASKAKSFAAKEGMLRPSAANAAKGAATIGAMEAAGPIMAVAGALAEADKATGYKRTQYSGNFGGPSFQTNPYASGKPAYAGQSVVSKLMGVGKKGK